MGVPCVFCRPLSLAFVLSKILPFATEKPAHRSMRSTLIFATSAVLMKLAGSLRILLELGPTLFHRDCAVLRDCLDRRIAHGLKAEKPAGASGCVRNGTQSKFVIIESLQSNRRFIAVGIDFPYISACRSGRHAEQSVESSHQKMSQSRRVESPVDQPQSKFHACLEAADVPYALVSRH
eukprot:COSAG02_NODE_702_length_18327_cov_85.154597_13_plen_179_part_00